MKIVVQMPIIFVYVSDSSALPAPLTLPPEGQPVMPANSAWYFRRTLTLGQGGGYGDQLFFQQGKLKHSLKLIFDCSYTLKSNSSFVFYAKILFQIRSK